MPLHHTEEDDIVKTIRATVNHDSISPISLGTLPANAFVTKTEVYLSNIFNGVSPTIELGTAVTKDLLFNDTHINMTMSSGNLTDFTAHFTILDASNALDIQADYIADSSTAGSLTVIVYYI